MSNVDPSRDYHEYKNDDFWKPSTKAQLLSWFKRNKLEYTGLDKLPKKMLMAIYFKERRKEW